MLERIVFLSLRHGHAVTTNHYVRDVFVFLSLVEP